MSALYVSVWTDQKSLIKLTASRRKVNKARKDSVLPRELFGISLRQASGPGSDADCSKRWKEKNPFLFSKFENFLMVRKGILEVQRIIR
jgi:hypothetical protein